MLGCSSCSDIPADPLALTRAPAEPCQSGLRSSAGPRARGAFRARADYPRSRACLLTRLPEQLTRAPHPMSTVPCPHARTDPRSSVSKQQKHLHEPELFCLRSGIPRPTATVLLEKGTYRYLRVNKVSCPVRWSWELAGRADLGIPHGRNVMRHQGPRHPKPRRHIYQVGE